MNVQTKIIAAIEKRLTETKSPCKVYKTHKAADKVGAKKSVEVGENFGTHASQYIVIEVPGFGFIPAFGMTELFRRNDCLGGYVFFLEVQGFYTY